MKAQAIAEDAKVKVDRRVVMVQQGADSKEDLETSQTTYKSAIADQDALVAQQQAAEDSVKVAQSQLKVAQLAGGANQAQVKQFAAALQSAQIDLDHTNIMAPVDGVVVSRNVDVGQTVAASLAAPTLFLIAQDLTKMQVDTNVSEADVGRVRVGQPATFTVDAYPGQTFTGTVTSIRKAPINVQNVITYDAVIGVVESGPEAVSRHDGEREDSGESAPECVEGPQRRAALSPRVRTVAGRPGGARRRTKAVWILDKRRRRSVSWSRPAKPMARRPK